MANKKLSDLTVVTEVQDTDHVVIMQSGEPKLAALSNIGTGDGGSTTQDNTIYDIIPLIMKGGTGTLFLLKAGTSITLSSVTYTASADADTWFRHTTDVTFNNVTGAANVLKLAYINTIAGWYCANMSSLISINLSGANASITALHGLFSGCSALTDVNFGGLNTAKVTTFYNLFASCSSLTSVDISCFDTTAATNIGNMFQDCSALRYITLGSGLFNTTQTIPFSGATNLGLNADGTDNGWLAHLAETAPTITDGNARTIQLPTKLKALSTSATYITTLTSKGYTVS